MDLILPDQSYLINIAVIGFGFILIGMPWALALTHVLTHKFDGYQKQLWIIVLLTTGIFGALTYFFVGWKQAIRHEQLRMNNEP